MQSTVMCLMAEAGDFGDRPDFAIFADTHWEPQGVYHTLDWLREQVSFPIIVTDNGRSLKDDVTNGVNAQGKPWLTIPAYLANEDGSAAGINWRQCTKNYKLDPIRKKSQEMLGVSPREAMPDGTWIENVARHLHRRDRTGENQPELVDWPPLPAGGRRGHD